MSSATAPLKILGHWSDLSSLGRERLRSWGTLQALTPDLRAGICRIIEDVRLQGDDALLRALAEFDGCAIGRTRLRVSDKEFACARDHVSATLLAAIRDGISHIRRFNERLTRDREWSFESEPGLLIGEKITPVDSAGLFIPGGKASYPSVLMHLGTAAAVAGVPKIVVAIPPLPGRGSMVDDAVLVVADELGLHDVYRVNGPAGVAALAFGTETVPRVRKVVGPGSLAVLCAQLEIQRYGCQTAVLMGPSESMILADDTADRRLLAADLLNEAEHGPDSASLLVTDSPELLAEVQGEVAVQLAVLPEPRRSYAVAALGENGGAILVGDMIEGAEVVNEYAPEHLQLAVVDEDAVLARVQNAGEILVGQWTPISAANFLLGCPATLPTGGFAKVTSGVTALTFLKRTAVARADREALRRMSASIISLAQYEGFPAHQAAVRIRMEQ